MKKPYFIIPFVILSLLLGIYTGWLRMGWAFPVVTGFAEHGALMIGSFLGTLIIVERVISFKNKWILIIPFVNALSLIFFLSDLYRFAYICLSIGALGYTVIMFYYAVKFKEYANYLMLIGALCYLFGNLLLLKINLYPPSTTWWIAFFLLTITAERLELTRYLPVNNLKKNILAIFLILFLAGIILPFHSYGKYISAGSLVLIAAWLLFYDIAMKSVKKQDLFRFSALLLIIGYFWLFVTSVFFVLESQTGFFYDAGLHSFFIGFVFSMIFAHAPIILPGITKLNVKPYHPTLYIWFILLQLSLFLRMTGDILTNMNIRQWGGIINGVSILGFFINLIIIVRLQLKNISG